MTAYVYLLGELIDGTHTVSGVYFDLLRAIEDCPRPNGYIGVLPLNSKKQDGVIEHVWWYWPANGASTTSMPSQDDYQGIHPSILNPCA